jgi:uncharacterized damage-inducible protein DinB
VSELQPPAATGDERELLLGWLEYLRQAVIEKAAGLSEDDVRWQPDGALIALIGIVNHLTHVEWRWIDGSYLRDPSVSRSEEEFHVGPERTLDEVLAAYRRRAARTDASVRAAPGLEAPCFHPVFRGIDLRWVVVHLIEETARHAGHADATRELLDRERGR